MGYNEGNKYIKPHESEVITMAEVTLTNANFENEVLNSDKPVLVDFWATWCGPCKMLGPVIKEIADENPQIKVGKVDVDNEPELARKFGIESIPTVIVFKDGKQANMSVGFRPKQDILALL